YRRHLESIKNVIGLEPGVNVPAGLSVLVLDKGVFFFCDAHVNYDPTAAQLAEITSLAAEVVKQFGITPKVTFIFHSCFGSRLATASFKVQKALTIMRETNPSLEEEG